MAIKYYKLYDILKRKGELKTKDLIKTPENPEGILSPRNYGETVSVK